MISRALTSHRFVSRACTGLTGVGLGIAALSLLGAPAQAQDAPKARVSAVYDISYSGVPVATADYSLTLVDGRYQVGIAYKTTGVLGMIGEVRGKVSGQGRVAGGAVQPGSYALDGKDPRRTRKVRIDHGASGLSYQSEPAPKVGGGRVPLTADVIRGAFDPIGALVITARPGSDRASVCNRALPIFDGWTRYDVLFSPKGERPVRIDGYDGPALVCGARLKNVAGHKPQDATTRYWDENRALEARLIPAGASGVYVPAGLSIKTQYGQIEIALRRVSIEASKAADASTTR